MISIDDHPTPDPSSSHHHRHHQQQLHQQISDDLKVSDTDLKSPDLDDTNNPTPNFSIRDYVFSLRSKDVACNWPFSHRSLQLCLKHGVKNLLPPFQSLDKLKDNSCLRKCRLENRFPAEEFVRRFDGKSTENQLKFNKSGSVSRNLSGSIRGKESRFHFQEHLGHTRSKEKPPTSSQKTENIKKSRLIVRLNSGVEPVGEVAPNSLIVSETMAAKVCPVCKIFTSSSNTTLNAHIDQCLTGEGTMKWTGNPKVIVKHRIKPRKMRLMVDIYETAPHCTVEELDRRNGTRWATNSSFPAQEFEYQGEEDKEEPRMNNEGDVYIDTNGTKVRILSVPKVGSSNDHRSWKLIKGVKGSKIVMGKKKSNIFKKKHHQKYLKLSPNARKLCSPKPQARNDQEDVVIAKNCSKDEQCRKERTQMHDDYEGSPDSSPQHSDGADFRSKGANFSYLRRNLSFSEAKINTLKRKFSTIKKSSTLCLLNEKYVDEPSQDSLEQTKLEEHMGLLRKEETRSVTKKSSNEESVDEFADVQSIRNETLPDTERDCVVPGSFVCLSNSFDECIGLYQDSPGSRDDIEKDETFFREIDPIPIPGPPGSFLPSPGGETVSEEQLHENSSLTTTTRVLSIENHNSRDVIDQDSMSTSPVSDISNPSLAISDSRSLGNLAYKSTSVDDTYKKSLPNGDTSFKTGQPCCCSRKEASGGFRNFDKGLLAKESSFSYTVASNHQDLSVLRKQAVDSHGGSSGLSFKPGMFTLSNYPTSPVHEKPSTVKVLPADGYCASAASPSKPVLRLMGKNLTVVKTDEDVPSSSRQFKPLQSTQQPVIFGQYRIGSESQNFNGYPQINMPRNLVDLRPDNGGFMPLVDRYGHNGAFGSKSVKEIVVIDDSSENEGDGSMGKEFWRQMNPLYMMHQHPYGGIGGGSSVVHGGGLQTSLPNRGLGEWKLGSSSTSHSTSHL